MFEKLVKLQLVLLALILALGAFYSTRYAVNKASKNSISVTGSSYELVNSDSGRLQFEIITRKPTKNASYGTIQTQLPVVLNYLEEKGFTSSEIDVQTQNGYNLYKYTENGISTNEIAYYNLSQPIVVKSSNVKGIKDLSNDITKLINMGIDINVSEPEYYYSKLSDIKVKLLKAATKDAQQRAFAMLSATHNKPGKIQSVRMGVFQITPVDSNDVSDMGISDTTSIEKKITAVANVVFEIK